MNVSWLVDHLHFFAFMIFVAEANIVYQYIEFLGGIPPRYLISAVASV